MFQKTIGVDKKFKRVFDNVVCELGAVKGLSISSEETEGRLYAVAACANEAKLSEAVEGAVYNAVLKMKLDWFLDRMAGEELTLTVASLALALLYFEEAEERPEVLEAVSLSKAMVNVDGVFNFRMARFKENWEEAVGLAGSLIAMAAEEEDILSAATFLVAPEGGGGSTILIYKLEDKVILKNIVTGHALSSRRLFDNQEFDLLATLLSARPFKVIVSGDVLSTELVAVLKHFAKIKKASG